MKSSCCSRSIFRWQAGRSGRRLHSACALERGCGCPGGYGGESAQPGDHILVMSNGGFGGIHQKLLDGLAKKAEAAAAE